MQINEYFGDWLKVIDINELYKVVGVLNPLYKTKPIVPEYHSIFKAFTLCSLKECKIVFLAQDPYPQKGIATGVVFGNKEGTLELSPSLEVTDAWRDWGQEEKGMTEDKMARWHH